MKNKISFAFLIIGLILLNGIVFAIDEYPEFPGSERIKEEKQVSSIERLLYWSLTYLLFIIPCSLIFIIIFKKKDSTKVGAVVGVVIGFLMPGLVQTQFVKSLFCEPIGRSYKSCIIGTGPKWWLLFIWPFLILIGVLMGALVGFMIKRIKKK